MFMYFYAGIMSAVCHICPMVINRKTSDAWYNGNNTFKARLIVGTTLLFVAHTIFWPLIILTETLLHSAST